MGFNIERNHVRDAVVRWDPDSNFSLVNAYRAADEPERLIFPENTSRQAEADRDCNFVVELSRLSKQWPIEVITFDGYCPQLHFLLPPTTILRNCGPLVADHLLGSGKAAVRFVIRMEDGTSMRVQRLGTQQRFLIVNNDGVQHDAFSSFFDFRCTLRAISVAPIPVIEHRAYEICAALNSPGDLSSIQITSGCRRFSLSDAYEHWCCTSDLHDTRARNYAEAILFVFNALKDEGSGTDVSHLLNANQVQHLQRLVMARHGVPLEMAPRTAETPDPSTANLIATLLTKITSSTSVLSHEALINELQAVGLVPEAEMSEEALRTMDCDLLAQHIINHEDWSGVAQAIRNNACGDGLREAVEILIDGDIGDYIPLGYKLIDEDDWDGLVTRLRAASNQTDRAADEARSAETSVDEALSIADNY